MARYRCSIINGRCETEIVEAGPWSAAYRMVRAFLHEHLPQIEVVDAVGRRTWRFKLEIDPDNVELKAEKDEDNDY